MDMVEEFHANNYLESSTGMIEKLNFLHHVLSITSTPFVALVTGLADEFTTFVVPHSFIALRLKRLTLSFDMKLCGALVSSSARTAWPLVIALT